LVQVPRQRCLDLSRGWRTSRPRPSTRWPALSLIGPASGRRSPSLATPSRLCPRQSSRFRPLCSRPPRFALSSALEKYFVALPGTLGSRPCPTEGRRLLFWGPQGHGQIGFRCAVEARPELRLRLCRNHLRGCFRVLHFARNNSFRQNIVPFETGILDVIRLINASQVGPVMPFPAVFVSWSFLTCFSAASRARGVSGAATAPFVATTEWPNRVA